MLTIEQVKIIEVLASNKCSGIFVPSIKVPKKRVKGVLVIDPKNYEWLQTPHNESVIYAELPGKTIWELYYEYSLLACIKIRGGVLYKLYYPGLSRYKCFEELNIQYAIGTVGY